MRDDTITIRGPFEIQPIWCEAYETEDDDDNIVMVEAHWMSMEHMRRVEFETRACPCGLVHAYTLDLQWTQILAWPQLAEWALDSAFATLKRSLEECEAARA